MADKKKIGRRNLYYLIKKGWIFGTENLSSNYNLVNFPGLERGIKVIKIFEIKYFM